MMQHYDCAAQPRFWTSHHKHSSTGCSMMMQDLASPHLWTNASHWLCNTSSTRTLATLHKPGFKVLISAGLTGSLKQAHAASRSAWTCDYVQVQCNQISTVGALCFWVLFSLKSLNLHISGFTDCIFVILFIKTHSFFLTWCGIHFVLCFHLITVWSAAQILYTLSLS